MARYFLTKTTVEPGALVEVAGTPALSRYDALVQSIQGMSDPESIGVLAEPMLSHGNDTAPATVVWYSSYPGEPRRLSDFDPDRREAVLSTLRTRLIDISKGLSDPSFGPLVGAALNVLDPDDIYVVDGQPVLVGWGMVPPDANVSSSARSRHFAQSMARHLPMSEAPPITPEEWRSRRSAAPTPEAEPQAAELATARPADRAAASGAATTAAGGTGGGGAPPVSPMPARWRGGGWRWIPLAALLLISVAALVWLLWPGTRVMPPQPPGALLADDEALRIAREANAALESRARRLEQAIAGAVCTPEGNLVLPDGRTPEGLLPPAGGGAEGEPAVGEARADALVRPAPERVQVPNEARAGESGSAIENTATLLELIESRTALVLVVGPKPATGSGFFVGPDLFVTNDHVVADAKGGGSIFVVNKRLGRVWEAKVLARLGPLPEAGGDYALLRVPGATSPFFTLRDSTETMRLQNVIAAGYPGVILETDVNFARLREGDLAAIPDLTVTDGIVNVEQTLGPTTRAIIHTARISGGNSGGPLVDGCGRVVGVNTFVRSEERTQRFLNFSLASTDLLRFLDKADVRSVRASGPCAPRVRAAAPPPRAGGAAPDGVAPQSEGAAPGTPASK